MCASSGTILGVDYLVYSSHKSGTQTLLSTLRKSSQTALHMHTLANLGLRDNRGELMSCLHKYRVTRKKPITLLSVFREPLERHISSFFQWHGIGAVRNGLVKSPQDTVIAQMSIPELVQLFLSLLQSKTLVGYKDSLHQICSELNLPVSAIKFDPGQSYGRLEAESARLFTFRFDTLFESYPQILQQAIDIKLQPVSANRSYNHWYHEKFAMFRESAKFPRGLIANVYAAKKDLIDIFYPGHFDILVRTAQAKYGA